MPTVSSAYLGNYVETCIAQGASAAALYARVPGGRAALDDPDARFYAALVPEILDSVAEETGIDAIGLRVGMMFRPATFLEVGYALSSASTLEEALGINARFQALTQEAVRTRFEIKGRLAYIRCVPALPDVEGMRRLMEAVFAGYATIGYWLLRDHSPRTRLMQFRHRDPGPASRETYESVFGCEIRFGAKEDMFVFPAEVATRPLPGANPELVNLLTRRLEARLTSLREGLTLSERVTNSIHTQLARGRSGIAETARLLGYSERTLRRHLAEEGTRYSDLLETARRDAAEVYVREGKLSQAEIAGALGYSDQSAFVRAFRSWHGVPPGAWRRSSARQE